MLLLTGNIILEISNPEILNSMDKHKKHTVHFS